MRYLACVNNGDGPMFRVFEMIGEAYEYGKLVDQAEHEICEFEGELLSIEYDCYGGSVINGKGECTVFSRSGQLINIDEYNLMEAPK